MALTNREDLLQDFIDIASKKHGAIDKATDTEKVLHFSWKVPQVYHTYPVTDKYTSGGITFGKMDMQEHPHEEMIAKIKERIKTKGWKMTHQEAEELSGHSRFVKSYFTILYNKERDSISIAEFNSGYGYSRTKERLFVIRKNIPLMCASKHLYIFKGMGRKYSPRIYGGTWYSLTLAPYIQYVLRTNPEVIQLHVTSRHMYSANNPYTAFVSAYGPVNVGLMRFTQEAIPNENLFTYTGLNRLIGYGGHKTREMLKVLKFRLEEGPTLDTKDYHRILHTSADMVFDRTK